MNERAKGPELSIRDEFARAFITGAHASADAWLDADLLARRAYEVADAMMRARDVANTNDDATADEHPAVTQ